MYEDIFREIDAQQDLRAALTRLKKEIVQDKKEGSFHGLSRTQEEKIASLMQDEDPKVRKNAVGILGEAGADGCLDAIAEAYQQEKTLFVRSSYLKTLRKFDFSQYKDMLRERIRQIEAQPMTEENRKHLSEELRLLRDMTADPSQRKQHVFTGYNVVSDMILLVSPGFEHLTYNALPDYIREDARMLNGAVEVVTDKLNVVLGIRTVKAILFRFTTAQIKPGDPDAAAAVLARSGILRYLKTRHAGSGPFYFRIDMKTRLHLTEKGKYIKRLAAALEEKTGGALINSASGYECEIRLIESKKGRYFPFLILHTVPDDRFDYRKNALATSMAPVRAAEIIELVRDYLIDDAAVLDPFCGNATLLIERQKALRAKALYGVDIYGEAIRAAHENTELAGVPVYLINRDMAEFTHKYKFDEILTELPSVTEKMDRDSLAVFYTRFINKTKEWTQEGAAVIVITTEPDLFRPLAEKAGCLKLKGIANLTGRNKAGVLIYHALH